MLFVRFVLVVGLCCWALFGGCQCPGSVTPDGAKRPDAATTDRVAKDATQEKPPERSAPKDDVSSEGSCTPKELLDHEKWEEVARADDPYKSMAPKDKPCTDVAFKLEDGVIEVETGICSFLTVKQPLIAALKKGDKLKATYWHLALTAASSAFGYFSFSIGPKEIYVNKIPIPSDPEVYEQVITLKEDFSTDKPLYFHIHNHGSNTWKLLSLEVQCPSK